LIYSREVHTVGFNIMQLSHGLFAIAKLLVIKVLRVEKKDMMLTK